MMRGIATRNDMSGQDMLSTLIIHDKFSIPDLISIISTQSNRIDKCAIINAIQMSGLLSIFDDHIETNISPVKITYESMCNTIEMLKTGPIDLNNPRSHEEAVYLAAKLHKLNICKAKNPILDYGRIRLNGSYQPVDENMIKICAINPNLINLTKFFEPILPKECYDNNLLVQLAQNEGYRMSEITESGAHSLLQQACLLETFYYGKMEVSINTETPILMTSLSEISPKEIISFGVRHGTMMAYCIDEIVELFRINLEFVHPSASHEILTPLAIGKLKKICEANHCDKYKTLGGLINSIEAIRNNNNKEMSTLAKLYVESDQRVKDDIKFCMYALLHLSMYMRGWGGQGHDYPLSLAPVNNQNKVDVRVTDAIGIFKEGLKRLPDGNIITKLPLIKYSDSSMTFHISSRPQDGVNLGERLEIVQRGDSHSNVTSCIRTSSNWFAASSYRYLMSIGEPEPFNIRELRYIS